MVVYKCGTAEGFTVKSAVPRTVGYVHSEYLSCTNLHGLLQHKKYH